MIDAHPNEISCVILEPSNVEHPIASKTNPNETYLHDVKRLCHRHGIVFILDEMITGFRWDLKGAQQYYKIDADLCTFGKAMANGFAVAAVGGKREIMEQGSIEFEGRERLFLLSTTHGAEMCGLGAFVKTVEILKENDVISHFWKYGSNLVELINGHARKAGLEDYIKAGGIACSPWYLTYGPEKTLSLPFRTLFSQEMIKHGVLMPWIALSAAHGEKELELTSYALEKTFETYKKAIDAGTTNGFLIGHSIKPVFRRHN